MGNDFIDPEIASLLGIQEDKKETPPKFDNLFEGDRGSAPDPMTDVPLKKDFKKISRILGNPHPAFGDKDFYNKALSGEGKEAARFHDLFGKFLKAQTPEDKSMFRGRVIPAFWDMLSFIAAKINTKLPIYKMLMLRFGMVSPAFLSNEQRMILAKVNIPNNTGETVYYQDEWLLRIALGQERPSATDEVQQKNLDSSQKKIDKMEKRRGQRDAEISVLRNKVVQLDETESFLLDKVKSLLQHDIRDDLGGLKTCFNGEQRKLITEINDIFRRLSLIDRDMARSYSSIESIDKELEELERRTEGMDIDSSVDTATIVSEFNALRQMTKLCVGRKGNHFPVLLKNYFYANDRQLGIRENVINIMADVETLDPGLFIRRYREQDNRIVPNVLLLPNYGEVGICWQPFEKYNRSTSRGRIAIPIFPKTLLPTVVSALGDLRWQVAKERAQHRWMEEGLTGRYYMWFSETKQRGDVKDAFIRDYILWITKESDGIQKLEREVRGIFWRSLPFPNEVKLKLKNRGFVYNELCKKDQNIAMSDGY
ncbi:MAG: hypothetical protein JW904_15030 [Spirochaetales bacterium]|nr:hypothetical protein [Spirochaetales bacterium]